MTERSAMSPLARRIEERKDALHIRTNVELAQRSGVSRAVITNIIKNPNKNIMAESAVDLANGLQCRVVWLITGEGPATDKEIQKFQKLKSGSPVMRLDELRGDDVAEDVRTASSEENRERYSCPVGNTDTTVVIRLERQLGRYDAGGLLFMDVAVTAPRTGQLVLASTSAGSPPELMEYTTAHSRHFLKSLSDDVPPDLRFVEMDERMSIVATYKAYALL